MLLQTLLIVIFLVSVHISTIQCCIGGPPPVLRARATMFQAAAGMQPPTVQVGTVDFTQRGNVITINGSVTGLTPGLHGIHVHENGVLTNNCLDAGGHYNPTNMAHGGPTDRVRHVGDLGNIITPDSGPTPINIRNNVMRLSGPHSVVGLALVIHAAGDDFNRGLSPLSSVTGNAGPRPMCGIIQIV